VRQASSPRPRLPLLPGEQNQVRRRQRSTVFLPIGTSHRALDYTVHFTVNGISRLPEAEHGLVATHVRFTRSAFALHCSLSVQVVWIVVLEIRCRVTDKRESEHRAEQQATEHSHPSIVDARSQIPLAAHPVPCRETDGFREVRSNMNCYRCKPEIEGDLTVPEAPVACDTR
jgi:hypothetical protein